MCMYNSEVNFYVLLNVYFDEMSGYWESGICLWQSCMVWGPRRGNLDCDGRGAVTPDGSHVRFVISKKKSISCQVDLEKLPPLFGIRTGSVPCQYIYTVATLVENLLRSVSICYTDFSYSCTFPPLFRTLSHRTCIIEWCVGAGDWRFRSQW
jgi:hypothetical protein